MYSNQPVENKRRSLLRPTPFKAISFVCIVLWAVMFRGQIQDVLRLAVFDSTRSYIVMIPLVVLYLVWLRRSRWRVCHKRPSMLGPVIVLFAVVTAAVGNEFDVRALWHAGAIIALWGIVVSLLGYPILLSFAPAVVVSFALIPLPGMIREELAIPLQSLATSMTATTLDLMGLPVVKIGNVLEIDGVAVAVGEACNGMKFLVPFAVVMYVFVFSIPLRFAIRVAMVLAALPIIIICNIIRLIPTSIAFSHGLGTGVWVHDIGGLLVIPLGLVLMYGLLQLLVWLSIPVTRWRLVLT